MRVKIESVAPLPHVKAWFSAQALPTIHDLKISLCSDLFAFKHASIDAEDIVLILDDFELLDSSPTDIVRDGDLIIVKKTPLSTHHKRKAAGQDTSSQPRKRSKTDNGKALPKPPTTRLKGRAPSPSSSESSSGSSSESSSDSDSSTSDSESSDSDSSSSSSSSSLSNSSSSTSSAKSSKKKLVKGDTGKPKSNTPPVPPGLGKPSTHSRNLRRRRKKMYERLTATAEPTSVNEIPLGMRAQTVDPSARRQATSPSVEPELLQTQKGKGKERERDLCEPAEPPQFLMASLQNKNKRRGFKDALSRGVPAKITFTEEQDTAMEADADAIMVEATLQVPTSAKTHYPRLIPPSERQELGQLPPNVFVTSVDVEEGMWPSKRKNKKRKKPQHSEETSVQEEQDPYPNGLPYDDEAAAAMQPAASKDVAGSATASGGMTERAAIAAKFDSLTKVTDKAQVVAGSTIAWTGLGINMDTLTPELLLHIARVTRVDEERLALQLFSENGAAGASFGGPVDGDEESEGPVEEEFGWGEVIQGDFRLVAS
ncbi:hypothetical protein K466DRAFT_489685 [Polyporus arcularius HHB13444]|uniref:Coilin n=1 Tax=Polyporus arcularius HHB13444 TaxID=1314778 RepID=A0A5C3PPW1_9APHY|nr:hypothetical protein K466DRAFT_489685 [Polyporus arcularius HHB13444]